MSTDEPKRILVVDDDPDIREILVDILSQEPGHVVWGAASGQEAHNFCSKAAPLAPPDFLVLDFLLGDTNGAQLLALLRDEGLLPPTTRVLLCAATPKFVGKAREYGADDGLMKPFELDDLLGKVENLLK